jgi:hypothetical protein
MSISNVSSVFSDVCCKCVYLDVAYVSHICCKCFTHMLQVFYLHVAYVNNDFQVFFASVSDACFKYFICLQTYVISVASRCFKDRSDVTHGMHVKSGKGAPAVPTGAGPRVGA